LTRDIVLPLHQFLGIEIDLIFSKKRKKLAQDKIRSKQTEIISGIILSLLSRKQRCSEN